MMGGRRPDWEIERRDWPHADHSRFVSSGEYRWFVQRYGRGPGILFLHGTAASSHSFAHLGKLLSHRFEVMAVDLPGHGFTRSPVFDVMTPARVAKAINLLLHKDQFSPSIVVGHSAGAAIAVELAHLPDTQLKLVVSLNGALRSFGGTARTIFPIMAKALHYNPLTAPVVSLAARGRSRVEKLIEQTGSTLPAEDAAMYARLLKYSGHVSGALGMMAHWDLSDMERRIRDLALPILFVSATDDTAVPPDHATELSLIAQQGHSVRLDGMGHLAHEERPDVASRLIETEAVKWGILQEGEPMGEADD